MDMSIVRISFTTNACLVVNAQVGVVHEDLVGGYVEADDALDVPGEDGLDDAAGVLALVHVGVFLEDARLGALDVGHLVREALAVLEQLDLLELGAEVLGV